ncbi:MAG: sortase [Anaerolineales bacterium]
MKHRRLLDELSIEELDAYLALRKRQERLERLRERGGTPEGREVLGSARGAPEVAPPAPASRTSRPDRRYSAQVEERRPRREGLQINWRWVWDRVLLMVEILAILGLLLVILQLLLTVRQINDESAAAQILPTPTATPAIRVALLPSGHTPPDALGRSEPAAVPVHLRGLVEEITPLPVPTPGPEQAQRIVIDAIGVDAPVVEGDDWESLKKGAGHHLGSANPGERGNCVISAHNDIYGEIFRDLPEVKVGDVIEVHTQSQIYRYVAQESRIIQPTEVSVMAPTSSPVLTLISCYPYGIDTHRIVIIATLQP